MCQRGWYTASMQAVVAEIFDDIVLTKITPHDSGITSKKKQTERKEPSIFKIIHNILICLEFLLFFHIIFLKSCTIADILASSNFLLRTIHYKFQVCIQLYSYNVGGIESSQVT